MVQVRHKENLGNMAKAEQTDLAVNWLWMVKCKVPPRYFVRVIELGKTNG